MLFVANVFLQHKDKGHTKNFIFKSQVSLRMNENNLIGALLPQNNIKMFVFSIYFCYY